MKAQFKLLAGLTIPLFAYSAVNAAQSIDQPEVRTIGGPVTPYHFRGDVRDLPKVQSWKPGDPIKEIPRRHSTAIDPQEGEYQMSRDPLADLQKATPANGTRAFNTPIVNIEGQGFTGVNPPDTAGDIGKDYYIQSINGSSGSLFTIYNKSDGSIESGPTAMESLAPSGPCTAGDGDPIIIYDEVAQRWFMQEFVNDGSNTLCFYISATDDPVAGGWNFYEFSGATFPDYPHFGVWPDAYLGTANEAESTVYVFDRVNMIAGNVARPAQVIILGDLPGYGFQTATPVDWDGMTPPLAGTSGIFMRHIDEEAHGTFTNNPTTDILEMYEFVVDFDDSNNSSFNQLPDITITDFNSWFTNYSTFASVPQPGSSALLDPIREVILNKLKYRNFETHESIAGIIPTNINPDTSGSVVNAGLRWFELRRGGENTNPDIIFANGFDNLTWRLHQEGTYDPGSATENRLVGSLAFDQEGNIAMAYTKTDTDGGSPIPASIAYTGRLASDPTDVMTQPEVMVNLGSGANTSGRWGDYASMGVDPVDECTFWFTGEYQNGANWGTSISSFKFDACGEPGFALSSSDNNIQVCNVAGSTMASSTVNVISVSNFTGDVALSFNPVLPTGISGVFSANPVTIGNSFDTDFTIADTVVEGSYVATVEGTSLGATDKTIDFNIDVVGSVPSSAVLTAPADTASGVNAMPVFTWDAIANADSYFIEVATDMAFSNIVSSATVATNTYQPANALTSDTEYFWRISATNFCDTTLSSVFSFTTAIAPGTCAAGTFVTNQFEYDFNADAQGWTTSGDANWALTAGVGNGATQSFQADDIAAVNDSSLLSPVITLPAANPDGGLTLRFWNTQLIEDNAATACYDAGQLLISVNGGSFTQMTNAEIINNDYNGTISTSFTNPAGGEQGWCGDPLAATEFNVNVNAHAGQDVQFAFRMASDSSVGRPEGWVIDDVRVTNCEAP